MDDGCSVLFEKSLFVHSSVSPGKLAPYGRAFGRNEVRKVSNSYDLRLGN